MGTEVRRAHGRSGRTISKHERKPEAPRYVERERKKLLIAAMYEVIVDIPKMYQHSN
jgi:hypothetical protein